MIVNKFISSKSVIEDIFRNTQAAELLPLEDLLYFIYESLALMDQPLQFIKKVTGHIDNPDLDITNYRAELPCDFYKLERIAVNGMPVRYSGNAFHHLMSGACCDVNTGSSTSDVFIDNFGNMFSPQSSDMISSSGVDSYTFDINDNYLTLSTKEGKVCMAYLAFPTDKEGFPMIPDDIKYKMACQKYLLQKIRYIDWSKDPDSRGKKALFDHDEKEWLWYVGAATSKAKLPDVSQMENLKNQLVRLIPNINEYNNFFNTLGKQQQKRIV